MYLTTSELHQIGFKSLGKRCLIDGTAIFIDPSLISIDDDVRVDAYVLISANGSEVTIGRNVHIAVGAVIYGGGGVSLGDGSGLSAGVKIVSASDDFVFGHLTNPTIPKEFRSVTRSKVTVGAHAVVGVNSVLLPGATLGFGAAVAAQTLVRGSVSEFEIVGGNPMRHLGNRRKSKLLELHSDYLAWREARQ
jgi:dTDP-4-amino-4,6-dideoxy-D-glucose acyltransferase